MERNHYHLYEDFEWRNLNVTLKNKTLWDKFHREGTEMIITKSGRRMFPSLQVQITGLDPQALYCISVEFTPASRSRYKYSNSGGWVPAGAEESQNPQKIYYHPDSPATGEYLMSQALSFGRVKLTNTSAPPSGQIVLSSMHRYIPRIIITKTSEPIRVSWSHSKVVVFPETEFIAVTAYQNEKITKLKIDNNPFAKGFRETGQSKCKRKIKSDDSDEEPSLKKRKVESPNSSTTGHELTCPPDSPSASPSVSSKSVVPPYLLPSPTNLPYHCYNPQYSMYHGTFWNNGPNFYYPVYFTRYAAPPQPKKFTDFSINAIIAKI